LPDFPRTKVTVESDIYDLIPVFLESLSSELAMMANCAEDCDYELMREKIHSSKGAALTFGFTIYVSELDTLHRLSKDCDSDGMRKSLIKLNNLLENCTFVPAG